MKTPTDLTEVTVVRELTDSEVEQVSGGFLNNIVAFSVVGVNNQNSHAGQNGVLSHGTAIGILVVPTAPGS
jgi:hypothetical protein